MSGESISSLILFIAALLVAAGVAGVLVASVSDISSSIDQFGSDVSDDIDTDIEIISDPGSDAVYNESGDSVVLLIKNTGDRTLPADGTGLDVLVNGSYVRQDELSVTLLDDETAWRSGVVAEVVIDRSLSTDEHRVHVSVSGDEEVFEFYGP